MTFVIDILFLINFCLYYSELLDGVNIELRHGESQFMNVFIERLHEFRKSSPELENTLITFSSTCDYPDHYLGPAYGKPLEDEVAMDLIDQVCLLIQMLF